MRVHRPAFLPDAALSRAEMEALQRDIADAATFADDVAFDPRDVHLGDADTAQARLDEATHPGAGTLRDARATVEADATASARPPSDAADGPVVVGVDQAFLDDHAVSAVVALRDGTVVDRAHAAVPVEIPYVPGLLAFREGGVIVEALQSLSVAPDLLVVDGSGRIHFRQAGIATHVGVCFDVPAVGVAKNLLCGTPAEPLDAPLPAGARVPIHADDSVDAPPGTVIGHAYQSRQYDSPNRHVNPLYVSPGHRLAADTATDLVARLCAGYKLPEPTRLADSYADECKRRLRDS